MQKTRKVAGDISQNSIAALLRDGLRPGIKAVLYEPPTLRVLLCRLPDGYPHRFNFPGGGIDAGEMAAESFVREFSEEMEGPEFQLSDVVVAPIVGEGKLMVPRDEFRGKYEFIIALPVKNICAFKPKAASKIICLPPLPWNLARLQVKISTQVMKPMRQLYGNALREIPLVA